VQEGKEDAGREVKLARKKKEKMRAKIKRGSEERRTVKLIPPVGVKEEETLNRALIKR
jgi:hypothetical protein